jgi:hypothetical protein
MTEASITRAALSEDIASVRQAYEELLEEIRAVPEEEVMQINIEIPSAATERARRAPRDHDVAPAHGGPARSCWRQSSSPISSTWRSAYASRARPCPAPPAGTRAG